MKRRSKIFIVIAAVSILVAAVYVSVYLRHISMPAVNMGKASAYNISYLENGTGYISIVDDKMPIITLVGVFKVGAQDQTVGQAGIYHLIEHILLADFEENLNKIGAVVNGQTSQEHLMIYVTFARNKWKEGVDIFGRMISNPIFKEDNFLREREIVCLESKYRVSEPMEKLWDEVRYGLWQDMSYKLNTVGDSSTISKIDYDILLETYDVYFTPEKALIIVAGNVSDIDIASELSIVFSDWKTGPETVKLQEFEVDDLNSDRSIVLYSEEVQAGYSILLLGWNGPGLYREEGDTYTADVLCSVLNNPESVFSKKITSNTNITNYFASYNSAKIKGPFYITLTVKSGKEEQVRNFMIDLLRGKENYKDIHMELINEVKRKIGYEWTSAFQNTDEAAKLIARIWAAKDIDYVNNYLLNINSVNKSDIIAFYEKYIVSKKCIRGIILPQQPEVSLEG